MSLVEKWRHIAQLNLEVTSVLDNNNARGFGMALASAATDLESACTPRAPRPEWFGAPFDGEGKPTGKWDAWWVSETDKGDNGGRGHVCNGIWWRFWPQSAVVIPVAREGFPAPVGWAVVGG